MATEFNRPKEYFGLYFKVFLETYRLIPLSVMPPWCLQAAQILLKLLLTLQIILYFYLTSTFEYQCPYVYHPLL